MMQLSFIANFDQGLSILTLSRSLVIEWNLTEEKVISKNKNKILKLTLILAAFVFEELFVGMVELLTTDGYYCAF